MNQLHHLYAADLHFLDPHMHPSDSFIDKGHSSYKPSKKTAFQCCVGLHLDVPAAEKLLKLAGYALSPSEPYDLVIRFCLEKEIWELDTINYLLGSFDLESLDG